MGSGRYIKINERENENLVKDLRLKLTFAFGFDFGLVSSDFPDVDLTFGNLGSVWT